MENFDYLILGGGLAGLSLADRLKGSALILESGDEPGGLCRSYEFCGVSCDVGPHIIFSRDNELAEELQSLAPSARIRRSNRIFHKGRFVKYPFENELSALEPAERDLCVKEFIENPCRQQSADNMLAFFLKIFGRGITDLYLRPYNEKIWKYSPALMDTQMVERIPRPPDEDVLRSARGESTEGYEHQLYFNYPEQGGTGSLIKGLLARIAHDKRVLFPSRALKLTRTESGWTVETKGGVFSAKKLVNCMPLPELFRLLEAPPEVKTALGGLLHNSIHIVMVHALKDNLGDNFAVMCADRDVIFHRLSKLGFLGPAYKPASSGEVIMAEVTFRPGTELAALSREQVSRAVVDGLEKTGLVRRGDVAETSVRTFEYAYVIYDLKHRQNVPKILEYLDGRGIRCCGRFAEWEYLNMDAILAHSRALAAELNSL